MLSLLVSLTLVNANPQPKTDLLRTFAAICWVESRGDPKAVNKAEGAVGIAQIRAIMVADCNRIIGYAKWTLADRTDVVKSWEMFRLYSRYYAPRGTPEIWSRNWNGGPTGCRKAATLSYWHKVERVMK